MRNTRAGIRLYAEDGVRVLRQLRSNAEANDLLASKQAEWHYDRNGYCIGIKLISKAGYAFGGDSFRSTGLSAAVMQHNALGSLFPKSRRPGFNGCGNRDSSIIGNFVDYAMSVVEAWPEVSDGHARDRAVMLPAGVRA